MEPDAKRRIRAPVDEFAPSRRFPARDGLG